MRPIVARPVPGSPPAAAELHPRGWRTAASEGYPLGRRGGFAGEVRSGVSVRSEIERGVFWGLELSGLLALAERFSRGLAILAYHGVTDAPARPGGNLRRLHIPGARFEEHLRLITRRYRPVSLNEAVGTLTAGATLRPRSVVITFDDGYRNFLTAAMPRLLRFGVPATLFVLTGAPTQRLWQDRLEVMLEASREESISWRGSSLRPGSGGDPSALTTLRTRLALLGPEREQALGELSALLGSTPAEPDPDRDLLSWDELRQIKAAGFEIGSHADIHEPLTERPRQRVGGELRQSREVLERELGPARYALAYPYGAHDPGAMHAAKEAAFSCGLTTEAGLNDARTPLFALRRMLVGLDHDASRLRFSLSGARALLPARSRRSVVYGG